MLNIFDEYETDTFFAEVLKVNDKSYVMVSDKPAVIYSCFF